MPKVIDFGIAKATEGRLTDLTVYTELRQFIGTPAYMSPEQAEMSGLDIDTRSDIYSLGVLLYELLTGCTPLDPKELVASGLEAMRRTIREREPARPSTRLHSLSGEQLTTTAQRRSVEAPRLIHQVRGDLDWIVMKCLEKDRTRRYETSNGLAADLMRFLKSEPVVARPPSAAYRFQKAVRRNKVAFASATVVLGALVIGATLSGWQAVAASRARDRAREANRRLQIQVAETDSARQRADAAARSENTQRLQTEAALERMQLQRAEELLGGQQAFLGVAYLSRMLRTNPSNQVAAARLVAAIQRPFAMPLSEPLRHETATQVISPGSAQFSPDGLRVVTSCGDTARLWDVRNGQPLTAPLSHEKEIRSAQFSPDGRLVLTASEDGTARIWDTRTGQLLGQPLRHNKAVLSAQFSPDGSRVVTSSEDQTVRVWDTATGQPVSEALEHPAAVVFARFSSDGSRIITASGEGILRQWDIRSSRTLIASTAHIGPILSAEFSEDGSRAVTIGARLSSLGREGIRLENVQAAWVRNVVAGQPLPQALQHGAPVTVARMSRDGLRVLTAAGNVARVWDAYTGRLLTDQLRHEALIVDAQFSPDGLRVVSASKDGTARVWDAETGRPLTEPIWHDGDVLTASFSPDGSVLVTAAWDKTFRLWNVRTAGPLPQRIQLEGSARWAEFSPDGSRVLTTTPSSARIWEAESGLELRPRLGQGGQVMWARFSPNGARVVTASADKTARVWDAKTGQPVTQPFRHEAWVTDAEFSPDSSKVVTASYDGSVRVWDAATGLALTEPLRHRDQVNYVLFSPDGKFVATASSDQTARVWDARTGSPVTTFLQHEKQVLSLEFSSDGARIVTASLDNTARIWDARTGLAVTASLRHEGVVNYAQFSPDGTKVLTASADKTARIWDSRTGKQIGDPLYHAHGVGSALFSPDDSRVLTMADRSARVWDAQSGLPVVEPFSHEDIVCSSQFSPTGSRVVTASSDSTVRIWEVLSVPLPVPTWFLDWAEARVGRRLALTSEGGPISFAEQRRQWEQVQARRDTNIYIRIALWVQAEPTKRTIAPGAAQTTEAYVKQRVDENTGPSLHQAFLLSPESTLACARQALGVPRIIAEKALPIGNPPLDQTENERVNWARRVVQERPENEQENDLLLKQAERLARQSLRYDPNESEAWRAMGVIAWLRNRPDEALTNLERVLAVRPKGAETWELEGDIFEQQARHEEALNAYEQSVRLYPATEKVQGCQRLQVLDKHAAVCRKMGNLDRAITDLRQGGVPERAEATDARLIDLSAYYNLEFGEGLLAQSLTGVREVKGRRFDARGCLFLSSGKFYPNRVPDQMVGIPIGLQGAHVHFLQGAFFCHHEPLDTPIGKYVLRLSDGTVLEKELILGQDVLDTQLDAPPPGPGKAIMACAFQDPKSPGQIPVHLYLSTIDLPHPDTHIATLDFISFRTAGAPFLVAVTVE